ncbi:MAG: acetolactate synthase large subunit, partial [Acidimicrobiia bacterium]|nr:acetolactate synthase large subunit [Acidimicrobiia bacterium]
SDQVNAAQALARRLRDHDVDTVFGLPGEENLAFVEALAETQIDLVVVRHEQHAAFMAATHGRLTGRPGVCLATLGPGALNLFTGLAHAQLGGMAVIAITGQKPRRNNEEGSFQVVDIVSAAEPITSLAVSIDDPNTVDATVDMAFTVATSGRPAAVLIELPEDVAEEPVHTLDQPVPVTSRPIADPELISQATDLIKGANRVVVLASSGANSTESAPAVTRFAEHTGIGVLATQLGKGAIPESHPMSLRSLGIHRPDYAHLAIEPADVVVAVGYQPVEHPPLVWNPEHDKTIIHVAPWQAAIEPGYQPTIQLVGDIAATLDAIGDLLEPRDSAQVAAVHETIEQLLEAEEAGADWPPSPLTVVRAVRQAMGPDDVVALDNGAYKIWFARHYPVLAPNTLLLDNALATMGAGLGTAMAAAYLHSGNKVLAVCGDGGFMMNVQELETATRLELDMTVLVVRDDAYGFIAWHQDEQDRPRQGVKLTNPDFAHLAAAFGASAHRVDEDNPLDATLAAALAESGLSVIDCPIDYSINEILDSDLYQLARKAHEDNGDNDE